MDHMKKAIVQIKDLKKVIKGKEIIKGLTFDIYPGEVFGFLGPNGAGKTTTIRMMVGLTSASAGDAIIDGNSIQNNFEKAVSKVGAIVENPDMYKFLSGYQNLKQYARMVSATDSRIDEIVKLVGLENAIHNKVKTYSLGMRQRLGLAQALLHHPSVLILDEPTNGLDPAGIRELRDYLRKLAREEDIAVIVSSHLLSEMELMCDRIGIVEKGKLVKVEDMNEFIHGDNQETQVTFQVEPLDLAERHVREQFPNSQVAIKDNGLVLSINREEISEVSSFLLHNGVRIYGIQSKAKSLEDRFLEVTSQ